MKNKQENYVPGWYVFTATVSMPEGLIRHVIKPGFSEKGENGAADRKESFVNSIKATIKLWGGYTEDDIKLAIKEVNYFFFTNVGASDIENKCLDILRKSVTQKSTKDISSFGISDKGSSSKEMFQVRKDLYDEVLAVLTALKDEDSQKYAVITSNQKALVNAMIYRDTNPSAYQEMMDKIEKEVDQKKSNDESVAKSFLSDLEEIITDNKVGTDIPVPDADPGTNKDLLSYFMKDEMIKISVKNEGKFYFSYSKDGSPFEYVISIRSSGSSYRMQADKGSLSAAGIKKLYQHGRFTFEDTTVKDAFDSFMKDPKPYLQNHGPNKANS